MHTALRGQAKPRRPQHRRNPTHNRATTSHPARSPCGSGLANLHGVLCEMAGTPAQILTPEEITQRAHSDPMCRRAIERFRELLGAVAGDFVLSFGAWDGVYITGGLAPHLAPWLREGGFRRRFEDKGRFSEALARVPTSVVLHRDPGLLGAVAFALVEAGSASAQFSR